MYGFQIQEHREREREREREEMVSPSLTLLRTGVSPRGMLLGWWPWSSSKLAARTLGGGEGVELTSAKNGSVNGSIRQHGAR